MFSSSLGSVDVHGRRILACDDERHILRALRVILCEEGYEVRTALNMAEALDVVARLPIDAAIVDLLLPDGDGIELCRRLRQWSDMPIIVLTAVGAEQRKIEALGVGADEQLSRVVD
jgi:two-component system KDP operon response regulator KdpE